MPYIFGFNGEALRSIKRKLEGLNFDLRRGSLVWNEMSLSKDNKYDAHKMQYIYNKYNADPTQGIVSYIQIFYDGLGLTHPLKAGATKNNSRMFYFTNLSLSPRYSSTLANIQLLAMCHTNDIKNKNSLNQLLSKIVSE